MNNSLVTKTFLNICLSILFSSPLLGSVVTFSKTEVHEMEIVDKGIATCVSYDIAEGEYVSKEITISDDQVAAICQELGIGALTEATIFGYNPTTRELVKNHAGYDGWRDASGDFHNWSADGTQAPACVKIIEGDKGDGGKTYFCYNRGGQKPQVIKCYWALANDEKAVLVEIDFIYKDANNNNPEGTRVSLFEVPFCSWNGW